MLRREGGGLEQAGPVPRVGIVGANPNRGWARDAHIPALMRMADRFRLAAVSARTQELADEAAIAFGAERACGDSLELARDPDIDVVSATVKVPEHRAIVLAALEAGKNVCCEWPLGRNLEEAREMAAAVTPASHARIGLQGLSSPAVRHAVDLVRKGALGDLGVLRVFSPTAGWGKVAPPHYAYLEDRRNGATLETVAGGHTLALIEHVVGRYLEVDARKTTRRKRVSVAGTGEVIERSCADHMLVLGFHEGGCVSTLEVAGGVSDRPFSFELAAGEGTLRLSGGHPGGYQVGRIELETSFDAPPAPDHSLEGLVAGPLSVSEAHLRLAHDIATGSQTVPDLSYAVRLTRLLDAIDAASKRGQRQGVADSGHTG